MQHSAVEIHYLDISPDVARVSCGCSWKVSSKYIRRSLVGLLQVIIWPIKGIDSNMGVRPLANLAITMASQINFLLENICSLEMILLNHYVKCERLLFNRFLKPCN